MDPRRLFGNKGEKLAAQYLKQKGYVIIESQFRTRLGEIDLIAKDGNEVVFVEVKTRRSAQEVYPEDAVGEKKLRRMELAAEQYVNTHALEDSPFRFDVIAIVDDGSGKPEIMHLKGV